MYTDNVILFFQLAEGKEVSHDSVQVYLDLSHRSLEMTQKYFNLKTPLYFDFTHLTCRTALDGKLGLNYWYLLIMERRDF